MGTSFDDDAVVVFMATHEHTDKSVCVAVFAYQPDRTELQRALYDFIDAKLGMSDYQRNEQQLRCEDILRIVDHYPSTRWIVQTITPKRLPSLPTQSPPTQ